METSSHYRDQRDQYQQRENEFWLWVTHVVIVMNIMTVICLLSGEGGIRLWFQRIIPTVLRFLRAGSCRTPRRTRPGPPLCTLLTPSETASDPPCVLWTAASCHPALYTWTHHIRCRCLGGSSTGGHVNTTLMSKCVHKGFIKHSFQKNSVNIMRKMR